AHTPELTAMQTLITRFRLPVAPLLVLSCLLLAPLVRAADEPPAAPKLVDQAVKAIRVDPDASKRYADQALALLAKEPNADLEIRARLILCDYQAERDKDVAHREISQ